MIFEQRYRIFFTVLPVGFLFSDPNPDNLGASLFYQIIPATKKCEKVCRGACIASMLRENTCKHRIKKLHAST